MKTRKILFFIFLTIALAINVLIIVESCIGGEGSASQSFSLSESIAHAIESVFPNAKIDHAALHSAIRKIVGHFLLFGLSGIFTCLAFMMNDYLRKRFKWWVLALFIAGVGLIVAVTSELIQILVPGRYGAVTDILIDFSGYLLFGGLTYLITYFILKRNKEEIKNPE